MYIHTHIYIVTLSRRNLEFLTKYESARADKGEGKSVSREYRISWSCLFRERDRKEGARSGESSEADYTGGGTAILRNFFEGEIA